MAKFGIGMFGDIFLQLVPAVLIVSYLVTVHADGQYPLKLLDVCKGFLEFLNAFSKGRLQRHNPLSDLDTGAQLFPVKRLADIIVSPGFKSSDQIL